MASLKDRVKCWWRLAASDLNEACGIRDCSLCIPDVVFYQSDCLACLMQQLIAGQAVYCNRVRANLASDIVCRLGKTNKYSDTYYSNITSYNAAPCVNGDINRSAAKLAGRSSMGYFGGSTWNFFIATLLSDRALISNLVPLKNFGEPGLALEMVSIVAQP